MKDAFIFLIGLVVGGALEHLSAVYLEPKVKAFEAKAKVVGADVKKAAEDTKKL